jgi:glyceraldehyde-3-phosphate dehydrogenase/erythrose-4-phosphate dehydrogenase
MKILVNGVGNIGTTLLQVLSAHRDVLGIDVVHAHKSTTQPWDVPQLERLKNLGVVVLGREGEASLAEVADDIDYVFDAGRNGGGLQRRTAYNGFASLVGASAQGTEAGFGTPYVLGLGMDVTEARHVHIPSCNTHAALAILRTLSDGCLEDVVSADFVVARRSEDIGNHERLVSGNVVARHLDPVLGTHHAIDADAVLRTIGVQIPMQSSDITTPSQFLHSTRFSVRLAAPLGHQHVRDRIERSPFVGVTGIFDSNKVFEIGRRFGLGGRLYNQAIFVADNLLVKGDTISGWALVPQEGNTILSTLAAFLQRTRPAAQARLALDTAAESLLLRQL